MPQEDLTTSRPAPASSQRGYDPIKRLIDLTVSAIGLLASVPAMLLVAGLVKLSSRGPVLYRARRAGLGGEPFYTLKFRTMIEHADREGAITSGADPRVTPVGRFLRHTKLDELPQLWNVLRGEMSLVGPRPESSSIVKEHFTPEHREVLAVRPGLTCTGTLYYYLYQEHLQPPAGMDQEEFYVHQLLDAKLDADLHYVRHRTLRYDVRLICQTAWILLQKVVGIEPGWRPPLSPSSARDADAAEREEP